MNMDDAQHAKFILKMHETTKSNNESMTERYRAHGSQGRNHLTFETSDLVWLHLHTNHSPNLKKNLNSCLYLMDILKYLRRLMIVHINLSCL